MMIDITVEFWFRMERLFGRSITWDELCEIKTRMDELENENKTPKLR